MYKIVYYTKQNRNNKTVYYTTEKQLYIIPNYTKSILYKINKQKSRIIYIDRKIKVSIIYRKFIVYKIQEYIRKNIQVVQKQQKNNYIICETFILTMQFKSVILLV